MYLEVCFESVKSCGGPFRKLNVHACGCFVFQSVLHHSFSPLYSLGIMKTKKVKKKIVSILIPKGYLLGIMIKVYVVRFRNVHNLIIMLHES